jgi:S1-C subfamily serine protease
MSKHTLTFVKMAKVCHLAHCGLWITLAVTLWAQPVTAQDPDLIIRHEQMLYTVVQVEAKQGRGSGTVIYSQKRDDHMQTFVLTNFHVIASAVKVEEEWDPREQEEVKKERREAVKVLWHDYNDLSVFIGTRGKTADIVAYDEAADLALLKVRDRETGAPNVARLMPEGDELYMSETVFAVGGGLGKPPFMSEGVYAYGHEQIASYPYLLSTAPIIFGNSGGALFHRNDDCACYEMIGVPSRVSATWGAIVTHMAWAITMETVRAFLRAHDHGFILGDADEPEEAANE